MSAKREEIVSVKQGVTRVLVETENGRIIEVKRGSEKPYEIGGYVDITDDNGRMASMKIYNTQGVEVDEQTNSYFWITTPVGNYRQR